MKGLIWQRTRGLEKFAQKLISDPLAREKFLKAMLAASGKDQALVWINDNFSSPFSSLPSASWQPSFVQRVAPDVRPGTHPLHEEGAYYCMDLASVFLGEVFSAVPKGPRRVIDVCASPGGKSVLASVRLRPESLIANETIGKRSAALISNLKRCGVGDWRVTTMDPKYLAEGMPSSADLVIVDAPCSGQSLIVKGGRPAGCFHPVTINKNAMRQRRILAHSASMVMPEGFLAYMTCTFSREENEGVLEWFMEKFPQFVPVEVKSLEGHESSFASFPCYRLWPQEEEGAGGFTSLLRRG